MSSKVKCTCGHSWDKKDSSKKDVNVCHICGKDNTMKDGGWLSKYNDGGPVQENYNDASATEGPDYVGAGYDIIGRNYSPAWGGQFEHGGTVPKAQVGKTVITERKDFKPWWNWGSVAAAGGERRQETHGNLGDLYAYYAGQPLKHNVLEHSQHKPTSAKNLKADYVSVNDPKFKQEVIDNYDRVFNKKNLLDDEKKINDNTYAVSGYTKPIKGQAYEKGHLSNAIGHYYLSKGKDKKGDYISYYDVFDAGTGGSDGGGVGETLGLTKPFELYDRIYIDKKTGKPKMAMGGTVPGSVGFSYARTKGIPSNGPYAKKTKASAREGDVIKQDNTKPKVDLLHTQPIIDPLTKKPAIGKRLDLLRESQKQRTQSEFKPYDEVQHYINNAVRAADVTTDLMQVGNFIPNPIAQTIGQAGNWLGAGIDAYQTYDALKSGNYGNALINATSFAIPFGLSKKGGYVRDMYNTQPGSLADDIARLGSREGSYRPVTALPGQGSIPSIKKGINTNRSILGALGVETYLDAKEEKYSEVKPKTSTTQKSNQPTKSNQPSKLDKSSKYSKPQQIEVPYDRGEDIQPINVTPRGITYLDSPQVQQTISLPEEKDGSNVTAQNGREMQFYQNGLDWKPKSISRDGSVIEDDRGQWDHPGEVTKINSNEITMQGVDYPVLGVSDTGDTQMMQPGEDYTYDGNSVTEYPMMEDGGWLSKYNIPQAQTGGKYDGTLDFKALMNPGIAQSSTKVTKSKDQPKAAIQLNKYKSQQASKEKERLRQLDLAKKNQSDLSNLAADIGTNALTIPTQFRTPTEEELEAGRSADWSERIPMIRDAVTYGLGNELAGGAMEYGANKLGPLINSVGSKLKGMKSASSINDLKKGFEHLRSIGKETLGYALNDKANKKAIAEGNEWMQNWIQHPATQAKIEEDLGYIANRNNAYKDELDLGYEQLKNYKPNSEEFPLVNQLTYPMHTDNLGVTYLHGLDPYQRIDPEIMRKPQIGSWISRSPRMSQAKRASTTVHEDTHNWASDYMLNASGQRNFIVDNMEPSIKDIHFSRDPETLNQLEQYQSYLAEPTEQHARIMELRKYLGHSPDVKSTPEYAQQVIDHLENLPRKQQPIDVGGFLNVIGDDPKKLSNMFNRLWATTPYVAGAAVAAKSNSKENKNGGWLSKYN